MEREERIGFEERTIQARYYQTTVRQGYVAHARSNIAEVQLLPS